jgi:hypothetical protein
MANWADIELAVPDLVQRVRRRFEGHPHHVLGTLDAAGAPRLSGINVFFNEARLTSEEMEFVIRMTPRTVD